MTETRGEVPARVRALEPLGVKVTHDYVYEGEVGVDRRRIDLLDTAHSVFLPLTPEEWCNAAMREGPFYVGGCCGNMGLLQDVFAGVFRDGGWADAGDMLTIGEMARGHEGFEATFPEVDDVAFNRLVEEWHRVNAQGVPAGAVTDPWWKVGVVFNAVEPMLTQQRFEEPSPVLNPDHRPEEQDIIHVLDGTLTRMSWADLFTRTDEDELATHALNRVVLQAKALPMVARLHELLEAEDVRFEGYALVTPGTDDVLHNTRGLCLYHTTEQAQRILEIWARNGDTPAEMVPVTVTVQDGLVVRR